MAISVVYESSQVSRIDVRSGRSVEARFIVPVKEGWRSLQSSFSLFANPFIVFGMTHVQRCIRTVLFALFE
jgi:hypothetical protein